MNRYSFILLACISISCASDQKKSEMEANKDSGPVAPPFLATYALSNKTGVSMTVTNFGGRIMTLKTPDKNGVVVDIVLGYDSAVNYLTGNPYFGALIGRVGNRIAKGKFTLKGKEYVLNTNNNGNALHGGPKGFHNVYWKAVTVEPAKLVLAYTSVDGEEGYPGNLEAVVAYTLTDENELKIDYTATVDKPTIVNLTHHSFFNLGGDASGDVLNHDLFINASKFTPVDGGLIPTGELKDVTNTPFDFRFRNKDGSYTRIGKRIATKDQQLEYGKGYDHNWVLDKIDNSLTQAAIVKEPVTGRTMEVWTTEPGLQFYSGNFLDGSDKGKGGHAYALRSAFCLEAQHYPDSPNHAGFPSIELKPGETYRQTTVYKFGIK